MAGHFVMIISSLATIAVGIVTYFVSTQSAEAIATERSGSHDRRIGALEVRQANDHDAIAEMRSDLREIKTDVKHLLKRID